MQTMELSGKAKRYLRALAHPLDPVVLVGKGGVNDQVISAIDRALLDHELIKVKLLSEAPVERHEAGDMIAGSTNAALVQVLGRHLILYRPHPDNPRIVLPKKGQGSKSADDVS